MLRNSIGQSNQLMRDLLHNEDLTPPDVMHSVGWFAFGITLTASGWFTVDTGSEGLRELVSPDTALFTAIGLETGVLSTAYFLARSARRRIYWLAAYLLTAALLVSFSDAGMRRAVTVRVAQAPNSRSVGQESLITRLVIFRYPGSAEAVRLAIGWTFALIPLLGFMSTRAEQPTLSDRITSLRQRMKEVSAQVESTEGLLTWSGRIIVALLFNRPKVDPRVANLHARLLTLRETVRDSFLSLEIPSLLHEKLGIRLLDMCSGVESIASATQGQFDRQGLLALNDCLDAVQSSQMSGSTKEAARKLLLDHFNQFHKATRQFTWADGLRGRTLGKEPFSYVGPEELSAAKEQ